MTAHYTCSEEGMSIFGSFEKFNRVLYGGHSGDSAQNRFFTFAGDTPVFMGASSDYTRNTWCYQAKNGVLMSGLALTPGHVEAGNHDLYSQWFHESSDILARWNHGWMSYDFTRFSPWFPDCRVKIQAYPLNPRDGFLVHYEIHADQRVIFCAGFGGITPFFGRFEYHNSERREFSAEDCRDNTAELSGNCGIVHGPNGVSMRIAAGFPCKIELDSAEAMTEKYPSMFLTDHGGARQIVRIRRAIEAGETFEGNIAVLYNGSADDMAELLALPDPCAFLRGKIREKFAGTSFRTPDSLLNSTVPDISIAIDASFHGKTFYHGAIGYHAPFLGWRGWYGPALLGWSSRVRTAIESHFATITESSGTERVWWDGADRPDLDHEGTQYHHLTNSSGHLTALLHRDDIYDMQEVAVDMTLFYLQHTGDLKTAEAIFARLGKILDWEERILDPDSDGLYENFLNTWISDGHSYDGAGCAQASAYNYYANLQAAVLAKALKKDPAKFESRADKILCAMQRLLWLDGPGVMAESLDTIGNRLAHPSPELSTTYLAIDCETVTPIQAFRMLKWTERNVKSIATAGRGGTLYFSSNWLPKKYSTCGIFPAENAALALAYFRNGQAGKAMEIVNGLADSFALSPHPGSITHVLSASGGTDDGDIDFSDVSGTWLRLLFEGLWGIRFRLAEKKIFLAPQLPDEWKDASLVLPGISVSMHRETLRDEFRFCVKAPAEKFLRIPMRFAGVDQVFLNGKSVEFTYAPGFGRSFLVVRTELEGELLLEVCYREEAFPSLLRNPQETFPGNTLRLEVENGTIVSEENVEPAFEILERDSRSLTLRAALNATGIRDGFLHAERGGVPVILPFEIRMAESKGFSAEPFRWTQAERIDLSKSFNCSLTEIHSRKFLSPRPKGYSIGMRLNGRYAWEWNHYGHNALKPDDSLLRSCGGVFKTSSGLSFATPASGNNVLCVSLWDNFPTSAEVPLSGSAKTLAVFFCATTNAMQSWVTNARFTVLYSDGTESSVDMVHQKNLDDFLLPPILKENETFYAGNGTHGTVQLIPLNPEKTLKAFRAEAVANEVIADILGLTLLR